MSHEQTIIADTFWTRLMGVKALKNPVKGTRMVFRNCRAIHTFGLSHNIEVRFLGKNGKELKKVESLKPWRIAIGPKKTAVTVEIIL